jgi:hypothetical protein
MEPFAGSMQIKIAKWNLEQMVSWGPVWGDGVVDLE